MNKIEKTTVDGRRAETHVQEQVSGVTTNRVTTHFEEKIPLEMKTRVTEKVVPIVLERVTEQFDGENVAKTIEKVADDYTRLTGLTTVQNPSVTKEDIEAIVKKAIEETRGFKLPSIPSPSWWNKSQSPPEMPWPPPAPQPVPAQDPNNLVGYLLITLLAVEVGLLVWQLFIR